MGAMPEDVKLMLRERAAKAKRPKLRTASETDFGAALDWYLDTFGDEGRRKSITLLGRAGVRLHTREHYIGGGRDGQNAVWRDARKSVTYPDDFVDLVVNRDILPTMPELSGEDSAPMDGAGLLASWSGMFWKMPHATDARLAKMIIEAGADAIIGTGLKRVTTLHRHPMGGIYRIERRAYKLDFAMALVQFFGLDLSGGNGKRLCDYVRIAAPSGLKGVS